MTVPRYAIWLEGFGWGVENHGVDPDVEVLISPEDWAEGRDVQLETAVRLAMEALESRRGRPPPRRLHPSLQASARRCRPGREASQRGSHAGATPASHHGWWTARGAGFRLRLGADVAKEAEPHAH